MDDQPTPRPSLPVAARRYIGAVSTGGAVVLLWASVLAARSPVAVSWPSIALLVALSVVSIAFPVEIHHRGASQGFNATVGVAAGLAFVAPDALVIPVVGLAGILGSAIRTRSLVKTCFNGAQEVLWAAALLVVARAVVVGEVSGDVLEPGHALAVVLGTGAAVVVNTIVMIELFHRIDGGSRRVLLGDSFGPLTVASSLGDVIVAMLIAVLMERSAVALLLAAPLLVGVLFGFRGMEVVRRSGRQARLMHDTSRTLLAAAVDEDRLREAIDGLCELFQARVAVLDVDGAPASHPVLADALARVRRTGMPILVTDGGGVVAVPVVLDGRIVGALAVTGRTGVDDWSDADVELLGTVAGEVASAMRARQLLDDVERERAALAIESERLGDILHGASDGIVLLDASGRVEACNPAMADVAGMLPEDVLGRRWDDVLRLEDEDGRPVHATDGTAVSRAFAGLGGAVAELRLRQPDGGWRWLRCSLAPVNRDGESLGVVLVAVDLTSQREVDELRGDFLATVSHELRTPLTPLTGFVTVLRERGDLLPTEQRRQVLGSMEKQLDRLGDLIGDLLLVAELDGGSPRVDIEELELSAMVAAVVDREASSPELRRRLDVAVPPVAVVADAAALRRALRCLVSNAIKHTDGSVRISTSVVGREVVVEVADHGPGIADADREVVFEPFRRLGNHLHRPQGPGLGLAIARSMAESFGGSVELVRHDGPGARFHLRVPHEHVPAARRPHLLPGVSGLSAVPAGSAVGSVVDEEADND